VPARPDMTVVPDEVDRTPDWPTLFGKAIDDISRIAQAEIRLLELRLTSSMETAIYQALATLIASSALLCALLCLVAALIMLFHRWLDWWLAFGIAGVVMLIAGVLLYYVLGSRARQTST
jgi:hypothetical protein